MVQGIYVSENEDVVLRDIGEDETRLYPFVEITRGGYIFFIHYGVNPVKINKVLSSLIGRNILGDGFIMQRNGPSIMDGYVNIKKNAMDIIQGNSKGCSIQ